MTEPQNHNRNDKLVGLEAQVAQLERALMTLQAAYEGLEFRSTSQIAALTEENGRLKKDLIEHKRIEELMTKRANELETVARVSMGVSTVLDTTKLLQAVVDMTKNNFNLYHAQIYLLDERADKLSLVAGADELGHQMMSEGWQIPLKQTRSLVARSARTRTGVMVNDVKNSPYWLPNPYLPQTRSELAVPMIVGERVLGVLDVQATEIDRFTKEDAHIQTTLAAQVAVSLENVRLFEEIRQNSAEMENQASRLTLLNEMATELSRTVTVEETFRIVSIKTHLMIEGDRSSVVLLDKDGEGFTVFALNGSEGAVRIGTNLTLEGTIIGRAVQKKRVIAVADIQTEKQYKNYRPNRQGMCSIITAPLIISDQVIGALTVESREKGAYDAYDEQLMFQIASLVAATIANRRLFEQTQKRAVELETLAQVSVITSTILDSQELIQTVVDLSKASFNLYHVQIYLLNQAEGRLTLAAASGKIGRQLVAEGVQVNINNKHSLVAQSARNRDTIVTNNVYQEANFEPHSLLLGTQAVLIIPLVVGDNLLGILDVHADEVDGFTNEDVSIQSTLATQLAAALQNTYLFAQTEQALAEAEILYQVGARLNVISGLDEVLQIFTLPEVAPNLGSAALLLFDGPRQDNPEYAELVAASIYDQTSDDMLSLSIGANFSLTNFPLTQLWLSNRHEPTLIGNISEDNRLDETLRKVCQQAEAKSLAVIPLTLGKEWFGITSMIWVEAHKFTDRDKRLYQSMAGQAAIVIKNWLLLRQTATRATQLEELSRVEVALSRATAEEEILKSILSILEGETAYSVSLGYCDTDDEGHPINFTTVSSWRDGLIWADDPLQGQVLPLVRYPFAQILVNSPNKVIFISDSQTDERIDETTRLLAQQMNIHAVALMPLHSGGRWQGLITFGYNKSHEFSINERSIFQQLLEPVATIVASRRAYLQQQATLVEMETLYRIVRRINEANDLQEVISIFVEELSVPVINRAVLATIEENAAGQIDSMTVIGNWHSGQGTPPSSVGTRYPREAFSAVEVLAASEPIFLPDVLHDQRIDVKTLEVFKAQNILAMVILPLWIGNRQIGALLLEAEEVYHFDEHQVRMYTSLAQQIAVIIDNQRFLAETRAALTEAKATQRQYTLQAWETYGAKNRRKIYEHMRPGEMSSINALPPEVSQAIADKRLIITLPPESEIATDNGWTTSPASTVIVPLTIRDEVIGVLGLQETDTSREWLPEEIVIIETVAREIAQAAENLRLLDETQQRAAREKRVNEIGEKIQAAQSLEEALRIAVKEVGLSLKVPQTSVQLKTE